MPGRELAREGVYVMTSLVDSYLYSSPNAIVLRNERFIFLRALLLPVVLV